MEARETFAAELEALVAKHGRHLNDNEVITTLEEALSRAWGFACEPQPASLFEHAPGLLAALRTLADKYEGVCSNLPFGMMGRREIEDDLAPARAALALAHPEACSTGSAQS